MSALYNDEIEQAFLGTLIVAPEKLDELEWFKPEWFGTEYNAKIYSTIAAAYRQGHGVSAPLIAQYFINDPLLDDAGHEQYIYDIADAVVSTTGWKQHAEQIQRLYARRSLKALAGKIERAVTDPTLDVPPEKIFAGIEEYLVTTKAHKAANDPLPVGGGVDAAIADAKSPQQGVLTGMPKLDRYLAGGFKKTDLIIIAGRPSMGKTAFGLTVGVNADMAGARGMMFSLEMSSGGLTKRVLSRFSGQAVHSGEVYDWDAVDAVRDKVAALTLAIDEAPGLTMTDMAARARRYKRKHKRLDFIIIDYLGLVMPEDLKANKVHQVEAITQGAKRMAKELEVPVILLCQLSRALEIRDNKRPQLSDLRDSGAIEQDADVVIFLYREEYYAERDSKDKQGSFQTERMKERAAAAQADVAAVKGKAEVIIAKQRQGRLGTVEVNFDGAGQVFYE